MSVIINPKTRRIIQRGGEGSGNWGHQGLDDVHGGSLPKGVHDEPGNPARGTKGDGKGIGGGESLENQSRFSELENSYGARAKNVSDFSRFIATKNDGEEYAVAMTADGTVIPLGENGEAYYGSGSENETSFSEEQVGKIAGNVLLHYHPAATPFSEGDVRFAIHNELPEIIVLDSAGNVHRMLIDHDARKAKEAEIAKELELEHGAGHYFHSTVRYMIEEAREIAEERYYADESGAGVEGFIIEEYTNAWNWLTETHPDIFKYSVSSPEGKK